MEQYVSNSHKSKEEAKNPEKKVERVVTGPIRQKKKSEIRKLTDVFVSEDISTVKSYILMDVLVPAIKKALSDIINNGTDMILYGGSGRNRNNGTPGSKVSYRSYYDRERDRDRRDDYRSRGSYDYIDYALDSRGDAEAVLSQMDDLIDRYKTVSVADYCELIGARSNYTDNKYGWSESEIRRATVVRDRDGGWVIKLPKPMPLD